MTDPYSTERALLERCRTILANIALEREPKWGIGMRWPIHHEPLRHDARNILPEIDRALAASQAAMTDAFLMKVRDVLARRFPRCHDCADHDGTCPSSGLPCDLDAAFAAVAPAGGVTEEEIAKAICPSEASSHDRAVAD